VTPAALGHLSAAVHEAFVAGYAESIQTVFLIAVPIAVLAFLASWLIPQVELKQWASTASTAPAAEARAVAVDAASGRGDVLVADGPGGAAAAREALDPQDAGRSEGPRRSEAD
jgi:hypothetical protein